MADHFKSHFSCLRWISIRQQSPTLLWPFWLVAHVICKIEIRPVTFFKSQYRERKVLIKAVNHDLVYSPMPPIHTNQIIYGEDRTTHNGCCWSCKLESFTKLKEVQSYFGIWLFIFTSLYSLMFFRTHIDRPCFRLKCHDDNFRCSFHASRSQYELRCANSVILYYWLLYWYVISSCDCV